MSYLLLAIATFTLVLSFLNYISNYQAVQYLQKKGATAKNKAVKFNKNFFIQLIQFGPMGQFSITQNNGEKSWYDKKS